MDGLVAPSAETQFTALAVSLTSFPGGPLCPSALTLAFSVYSTPNTNAPSLTTRVSTTSMSDLLKANEIRTPLRRRPPPSFPAPLAPGSFLPLLMESDTSLFTTPVRVGSR